MPAALLFSGGKDSGLAALLLGAVDDVALVSATFGIGTSDGDTDAADVEDAADGARATDGADAAASTDGPGADRETTVPATAREAAAALGYPLEVVELDRDVAGAAVERMVADGFPRNGIQRVHEHALEVVARRADREGWTVVADGTRRDDRVPTIDRSAAQSLEDRHGVDYVAPLAGFGRGAIDDCVERRLRVETGPSEALATADYETELRALMAAEHGAETVRDVFPEHTQSRVIGRR